jgi:TM2 domain-containing membrane protein YozV
MSEQFPPPPAPLGSSATTSDGYPVIGATDRLILPAALLCWFLGLFGAHRFYVGKKGSAIAQLVLTCTLIGIVVTGVWVLVDFIMIVIGSFTDKNSVKITKWT